MGLSVFLDTIALDDVHYCAWVISRVLSGCAYPRVQIACITGAVWGTRIRRSEGGRDALGPNEAAKVCAARHVPCTIDAYGFLCPLTSTHIPLV